MTVRGRPSTAQCVKCSRLISKRISTNILVKSGPYGIPKTLFWICNRCLPAFLDELEVSMPDDTVKPYKPRRLCRKCRNVVGKYANYCHHCGADLNAQAERRA